MEKMIKKIDTNGDGIGFVEIYDFSAANTSIEARVKAITDVASVCVGNTFSKKPENLFKRLSKESNSLPSSSFEFCPILLKKDDLSLVREMSRGRLGGTNNHYLLDVEKYGERVEGEYLLTNLRALINDIGDTLASKNFFNTSSIEKIIIGLHFKVFRTKMDVATARQHNRHRTPLQELSRRYVSGGKQDFEFYHKKEVRDAHLKLYGDTEHLEEETKTAVSHYNMLISEGVKAEAARRVIPLSMYTTVWSAWLPTTLKSFLALRTDNHTQDELRWIAEAMQELTKREED